MHALIITFIRMASPNACPYEHAVYMKKNHRGEFLIICLYVDDLLCTGNNSEMFKEYKQ